LNSSISHKKICFLEQYSVPNRFEGKRRVEFDI